LSRKLVIHVVYFIALFFSLFGAYFASQIDAPYGMKVAVESMLHSFSGWLMLYSVIIVISYKRKGVSPAILSIVAGLLLATYNYDLYVRLYQGYALHTPTRLEYVVEAPFMFLLTLMMGFMWILFYAIRA